MNKANNSTIQHDDFKITTKGANKRYSRVNHFLIGNVLGKGGFASVYKAVQTYTGKQVAVKIVNLEPLTASQVNKLRNEISIHKNLNHPNIAPIYQVAWTEKKLYIFMQYIKGTDLFQYISKHGPIQQNIAAKIFSHVIKAMMYLHQNGIAHRDIKAQNIIIDSDFNAKLIDFGLSKRFQIIDQREQFFTTFCGSISYTCPEILNKRKYSGRMVDIWCLGVTLYVMLEAAMPFDQRNNPQREQKIRSLNWNPAIYSSPEAKQIYKSIFTFAYDRASLEDILNSEFLEKYYLSEKQMLSSTKGSEESQSKKQIDSELIQQIASLLNDEYNLVKTSVLNIALDTSYYLYQLMSHKNKVRNSQPTSKHLNNVSPSRIASIQKQTITPKKRKLSQKSNNIILQKLKGSQFGSIKGGRKQILSKSKQLRKTINNSKQKQGIFQVFPTQSIISRPRFLSHKNSFNLQ